MTSCFIIGTAVGPRLKRLGRCGRKGQSSTLCATMQVLLTCLGHLSSLLYWSKPSKRIEFVAVLSFKLAQNDCSQKSGKFRKGPAIESEPQWQGPIVSLRPFKDHQHLMRRPGPCQGLKAPKARHRAPGPPQSVSGEVTKPTYCPPPLCSATGWPLRKVIEITSRRMHNAR